MHVTPLLLSTGLALVLAPAVVFGWAQAANGVWVASNTWYARVGNYNNVHESCTRMNSQTVLTSGECAYWTDGQGGIGHGRCYAHDNKVGCESCNKTGWSKCNQLCNVACLGQDVQSGIAVCLSGCNSVRDWTRNMKRIRRRRRQEGTVGYHPHVAVANLYPGLITAHKSNPQTSIDRYFEIMHPNYIRVVIGLLRVLFQLPETETSDYEHGSWLSKTNKVMPDFNAMGCILSTLESTTFADLKA
ncbi:hypothetical protein VTL71DRAFT_4274 [Oculimacula yallundae]|uniref:Uncharacterized protein n=1 Tax=Oculimacula yallundae TaxID=86028 RepID=A0ABR4C5B3_9HELO